MDHCSQSKADINNGNDKDLGTVSLIRCTLTGVDDNTSIDALWDIWREFPFVEFGVLYSNTQQGHGRYPSFAWIDRLTSRLELEPGPAFALHICGRAVGEFITGENWHIQRIAHYFQRIQLNFRADKFDPESIKDCIARQIGQTIVTQHNQANASLLLLLVGLQNHAVLFDESGGRGIRRSTWPAPFSGVECGYAGGLGPKNLEQELPCIHHKAGGRPYWIDMEAALRDDHDCFDIRLAKRCLDLVRAFLINMERFTDVHCLG